MKEIALIAGTCFPEAAGAAAWFRQQGAVVYEMNAAADKAQLAASLEAIEKEGRLDYLVVQATHEGENVQALGMLDYQDLNRVFDRGVNGTHALVEAMLPFLYDQGAVAYHFGDAVDMGRILAKTPEDIVVMGNISPVFEFKDGTPESIRKAVLDQMETLKGFKNYIPSSGCDIPPKASWANIDAYFQAVGEAAK